MGLLKKWRKENSHNKHNYMIGKIYPKSVDFRNYKFEHENFIGPNYIAVHKEDTELIKLLS